jgi:hypothetical protein
MQYHNGGKFINAKKHWMEGTKRKKNPKQTLRSRLKMGKKLNSTCRPPW